MSKEPTVSTNETQQKGNPPQYEVLQIIGSGLHARPMKIGNLWQSSKSDSLVGDTAHGKLIVKPRASQEDLDKLRELKQQPPTQQQSQSDSLSH